MFGFLVGVCMVWVFADCGVHSGTSFSFFFSIRGNSVYLFFRFFFFFSFVHGLVSIFHSPDNSFAFFPVVLLGRVKKFDRQGP